MANQNDLTAKLRNPRSWEYRFLKSVIERELSNQNVQEIVADNLDGENKNLDKIQINDVHSALTEYSPHNSTITSRLFLRPNERFKITPANLKHHLKSDTDLTKSNMVTNILQRVQDVTPFYGKVNAIKLQLSNRLLYLYQSQKKRSAMQAHFNEVLNLKYRLADVEDEVKEFVEKQHKVANQELRKTQGMVKVTLNEVMEDLKLRHILAQYDFNETYIFPSLEKAKSQIMKTVNPSIVTISQFIASHRQYKSSKAILKDFEKRANQYSEMPTDIDIKDWDNQRLAISLQKYLGQYGDYAKEALYNDDEALAKLIADDGHVKETLKTDKDLFVLIIN